VAGVIIVALTGIAVIIYNNIIVINAKTMKGNAMSGGLAVSRDGKFPTVRTR